MTKNYENETINGYSISRNLTRAQILQYIRHRKAGWNKKCSLHLVLHPNDINGLKRRMR